MELASSRLQAPAAQKLTAFLLRHFWTPVGVSVRGDESMRRMCTALFPQREDRAYLAELDSIVARLPGLGWFDLAARYHSPPDPSSDRPLAASMSSLSG